MAVPVYLCMGNLIWEMGNGNWRERNSIPVFGYPASSMSVFGLLWGNMRRLCWPIVV
jgi:hypothetical protein